MSSPYKACCAIALAACSPTHAEAQLLDRVTVTAERPTTLPVEIPTTLEGIDADRMERSINATDASDALKYLPSLVVRKRSIGDHDHAVLDAHADKARSASETPGLHAEAPALPHRRSLHGRAVRRSAAAAARSRGG